MLFLLTRPSRGATWAEPETFDFCFISTHTPLAGRDSKDKLTSTSAKHFYSHAPRGARLSEDHLKYRGCNRISTHTPLAGRDGMSRFLSSWFNHFYSHAPRGARLPVRFPLWRYCNFYSHAPRGARRCVWRMSLSFNPVCTRNSAARGAG